MSWSNGLGAMRLPQKDEAADVLHEILVDLKRRTTT
jgi:hypothetical protein